MGRSYLSYSKKQCFFYYAWMLTLIRLVNWFQIRKLFWMYKTSFSIISGFHTWYYFQMCAYVQERYIMVKLSMHMFINLCYRLTYCSFRHLHFDIDIVGFLRYQGDSINNNWISNTNTSFICKFQQYPFISIDLIKQKW